MGSLCGTIPGQRAQVVEPGAGGESEGVEYAGGRRDCGLEGGDARTWFSGVRSCVRCE